MGRKIANTTATKLDLDKYQNSNPNSNPNPNPNPNLNSPANPNPSSNPNPNPNAQLVVVAVVLWMIGAVWVGCGPRSTEAPRETQSRHAENKARTKPSFAEKIEKPRAPASPPMLLVAGYEGIKLIDLKGKTQRTLSKTPASHPRVISAEPQRLLFIGGTDAELRILNLSTGKEKAIARIPGNLGLDCGGEWSKAYHPREYIHTDTDFVYDPKKQQVCIELGDRNENMRDVEVRIRIDVPKNGAGKAAKKAADKNIHHSLVMCRKGKESQKPIAACAYKQKVSSRTNARDAKTAKTYPYWWKSAEDYAAKHIPRGPEGPAFRLSSGNFSAESRSPSGRWVVLSGNVQGGDYVRRQIILLDQKTGDFYPVKKGAVAAQTLCKPCLEDMKEMHDASLFIAGEARLTWIGKKDLLLVDDLLVVPGKHGYSFNGQPAMWGSINAYPLCYQKGENKAVTCR